MDANIPESNLPEIDVWVHTTHAAMPGCSAHTCAARYIDMGSARVLALLLAAAPTAYAECVLSGGQCSGEHFNGGIKKCCGASPCPRKTAP